MGSVEQEIEYWAVQKATLKIRNNSLQDQIDQIEHDQKERATQGQGIEQE